MLATAAYVDALLGAAHGPHEALAHLRRAATIEGGDRSIWDNLGIVLRKSGDHAGARAAFTTALALAPAAAGIWSNAAGNELDAGNAAEA